MKIMDPMFDKVNAIYAIFVTIMTYMLGEHWILFAGFLFFNVVDWITGVMKARISKKDNSKKALDGIIKKLGYWIMIAVAFGMGAIFIEIGETIGVNLRITTVIGWYVLASLMINEIRSILENLVESGYEVPEILIKGLEIADKLASAEDILDGVLKIDRRDGNEDMKFILDRPIEEIKDLTEVKLKVDFGHLKEGESNARDEPR